ncbi:uncharacterized protein METZ01_LOCUS425740, partial [marine metagenome]
MICRVATLVLLSMFSFAVAQELPTFGDSSSGIITMNEERKLGQQFLRSVRARAPTLD